MDRIRKASAKALVAAVAWMLLPLFLLRLPIWDWPVPDWQLLSLVLIGFMVAFSLGGIGGLMLLDVLPANAPAEAEQPWIPNWTILLLALLMNVGTMVSRASFNPFSCGNILECSNAAYQGYIEGASTGAGAAFEYLRILLAPAIYAGIAFSSWIMVFAGKKSHRYIAIMVIFSEIIIAIATGTSRNIANLILFIMFIYFLKRSVYPKTDGSTAKKILILILLFTLAILFFLYFSFLQINRDGFVAAAGLLGFNGGFIESYSFQTGNDSFILKGIESVVRYLATGYFSFSLALQMSPGLTFPIGSSQFLAMRAMRGGDSFYVYHSLPGQIESFYDWSYMQQWHSLFSWLLSDYSMMTVMIIMFFVGFLFVVSIYVAMTNQSAFSKLPLMIMFIFILYVPANNQVFQAPETAIGFLFSIFIIIYSIWRATRRPAPQDAERAGNVPS